MARSTASRRPEADKVYVAWQGFASDLPRPGVIVRLGDRFAGDHPIVRCHYGCFAVEGESLPDPQREAALRVASLSGESG